MRQIMNAPATISIMEVTPPTTVSMSALMPSNIVEDTKDVQVPMEHLLSCGKPGQGYPFTTCCSKESYTEGGILDRLVKPELRRMIHLALLRFPVARLDDYRHFHRLAFLTELTG